MKHVERKWKPLEEEGVQVCERKKWFLLDDNTNRLADENISMRR
jgi:hypothetical protein